MWSDKKKKFLEGNKLRKFVKQFHYLEDQKLPLLRGVGFGEGGPTYHWDAKVRKNQLIVLQVTLAGKGVLEIGKKQYSLTKNQAFFAKMPSNYQYYGEEWQFLFIEFSAVMTQWLDFPVTVLSLPEAFVEELSEMISNLENKNLTIFENTQIAFRLFMALKEITQKEVQQKSTVIQGVKEYIEEHYPQDISLDQLAEEFSLSKYQLIRQFEAAYHTTPMHYLKKIRIVHSLELLWEQESVAEVAQKVGFATGNYFSKVFKTEMGMTPSEYRNQKKIYFSD